METPTLKILLTGNTNVGKSFTFSWLTGIVVISANYPGTTVEYTQGRMNWLSRGSCGLIGAVSETGGSHRQVKAPQSMRLENYLKTRDVPAMTRSGRRPRRFCVFTYFDHNMHCSWRNR